MLNRKSWYHKGLRDGIPIALGYFAVTFTLGIVAKQAGLSAFQAGLAAALSSGNAGADIETLQARLRARGIPLTPAELPGK